MPSKPWQRQLRDARRGADELAARFGRPVSDAAAAFEVRATEHYLGLVDPTDPADPILAQVLPTDAELASPPGYGPDPVGDQQHERAPGLVVKHPGQALLVTTGACAVNCRYCFRRAYPYEQARDHGPALAAIEADPSLREVLLSGGDPLALSDAVVGRLLERLDAIPHVRRVRLHTRLPVVLPDRIDEDLLQLLAGRRARLWVVTHFNHPRELAPEALAACRRLLDRGIPVLNQSVLLAGVNDDADVLESLMEGLLDAGIKPYYLHQLDRVDGAAHFEVAPARGLALHAELRRRISGLGLPAYVRDLAGQASKLPVTLLLAMALLAGCSKPEAPKPEPTAPPVTSGLSGASASDVKPKPLATPAPTPVDGVLGLDGAGPFATVERVLAADLNGDGVPELLQAEGADVRGGPWPKSAAAPLQAERYVGPGLLQAWAAWDDDGDGKDEVWAAFGMGKGATDAPLVVVRIEQGKDGWVAETKWTYRGERNQATALSPWPGGAYVAAFSSRFVVDGIALTDAGATAVEGHRLRMGMARAVGDFDGDGTPDVAVGRLYGKTADADGDLRAIVGGKTEMIPTLRGVRAVAAADIDGDGKAEVLFGDGWHKHYGRVGRFRPTVARRSDDGTWTTEVLVERDDQYAVEQIAWDGQRLLAAGARELWLYERRDAGWVPIGEPVPAGAYGSFAVLGERRYAVAGPKVGSVVR